MRICIFSSFEDLLLKNAGPSVRIYNLAKYLAELEYEVHLVIPSYKEWSKDIDGIVVHGISGFCPPILLGIFSKLLGILRRTSIFFYDFLFILKAARRIMECDMVQIEHSSVGFFLIPVSKILRKPLVVDCHDAFQALRVSHTGVVRKFLETFLEKLAYKFASVIVAVSEREKTLLIDYGIDQRKIKVVPNGVNTKLFRPMGNMVRDESSENNSFSVIFVGNMEYLPNREAVRLIATRIAPKVLEKIGNVKFLIVGRGSDTLKISNECGLVFMGVVDNLADFLLASDVAIAPLIHGSGTRLKVLEYFSCGLPVVSTSVGVEGLDVTDGLNVFIENDVDKFAQRIVELLKNKSTATNLGDNAREIVTQNYDWRILVKKLNSIYVKLMQTI